MTLDAKAGVSHGARFPNGILLVDKEPGLTSFDVVRKVKRIAGVKKVGHAGTLDPFSTGLLILLLGQGTKLSQFLVAGRKRYLADIYLGVETDTLDPDGQVLNRSPVPDLKASAIQDALDLFVGEIEQVPPAYSAVKVGGVRAYKLARKGVEVRMPVRRVTVHAIELLSVELPRVVVDVICSPGTYLRCLARDLGKVLETGAHLSGLRRIASGSHRVEDAAGSGLLDDASGMTVIKELLIPLREALPDMHVVHIGKTLAAKLRNGYHPAREEIDFGSRQDEIAGGRAQLLCDGELIAVMDTSSRDAPGEGENMKIVRVFK